MGPTMELRIAIARAYGEYLSGYAKQERPL
jgi:hypothetical protein